MATLRIYHDIVGEEEKVILRNELGAETICYKDIQEFLDLIPDEDNNIDIRIHCRGGDCLEGWAIYDALRRSNKNISATIEGECSSMATIILLAAPAERRSAYRNIHMCLHNPAVEFINTDIYSRLTPDNLEKMSEDLSLQAKQLREEQDRILDLYVERTGANRKALQSLMDKDIYINAERAQELGFISTILVPTTARKSNKNNKQKSSIMSKPTHSRNVQVSGNVFARLLAKAGLKSISDLKMTAQAVTAADGSEFTVEREEGDPQVGDVAYPDGVYVLDDGTTVTVENEVITEISAPEPESDPVGNPDEQPSVEDARKAKAQELQSQIDELTQQLEELESGEPVSEQTVEELQQTVEELQQTIEEQAEALKKAQLSATDKAILAKVKKAGGAAWLDKVLGMRSTFTPQNRRFVEHGPTSQTEPASKTRQAINDRKAANAAKRAKKA